MAPAPEFANGMVVSIIHATGIQFLNPVMVPYGNVMGASLGQIALFSTVHGVGGMVSNVWMPKLCDAKGYRLVLVVALVGSIVANFLQAFAGSLVVEAWPADDAADHAHYHVASTNIAVMVFLFGRGLAGFFSGLGPVLRAYTSQISMPDVELMKRRMTIQLVVSNG